MRDWHEATSLTGSTQPGDVHTARHLALLGLVLCVVLLWVSQRMKARAFQYVSLAEATGMKEGSVCMVDCPAIGKHPTLTHHKSNHNPRGSAKRDTSTSIVLDSLKAGFLLNADTYRVCQCPNVSTNHFDLDSLLSVWCYINRPMALANASVLRHMARIGDFREGFLTPELVSRHGQVDGIINIREVFTALKLCCVINQMEKQLFSAPYVKKDCDAKMVHFLEVFGPALADVETHWQLWQDEYKQVTAGFDQLLFSPDCSVQRIKKLGLSIIQCPEPLHYYSLFSHTYRSDIVLTVYDRNRYEVEQKYTQFIALHSRPVQPRLDMAPLVQVLNVLEQVALGNPVSVLNGPAKSEGGLSKASRSLSSGGPLSIEAVEAARDADAAAAAANAALKGKNHQGVSVASQQEGGSGEEDARQDVVWVAERITDTGPLLRLEPKRKGGSLTGSMLTKAQRYGHPYDRPFVSSSIPPQIMVSVLQSFLEFGLKGTQPKRGGWSMEELEVINSALPMHTWVDSALTTFTTALTTGSSSSLHSLPLSPRSPASASHAKAMNLPWPVPPSLVPELEGGSSGIFSQEDAAALICSGDLPARVAGTSRPWRLVYCTRRHGTSLATFFRKAAGLPNTLLFVRDTGGGVFGAFGTEPWHVGPRFFGSGETFVFQLSPKRMLYPWQRPTARGFEAPPLDVKSNNNYFQMVFSSEPTNLTDAGAGHFAIWVDNDLNEGSSARCDTFASPTLSSSPDFHVHSLELWMV